RNSKAGKKESMGRRLNQLCPPYATPSSNSSLDYRRSDARIVENGFATTGGVGKSAKVVLVGTDFTAALFLHGTRRVPSLGRAATQCHLHPPSGPGSNVKSIIRRTPANDRRSRTRSLLATRSWSEESLPADRLQAQPQSLDERHPRQTTGRTIGCVASP